MTNFKIYENHYLSEHTYPVADNTYLGIYISLGIDQPTIQGPIIFFLEFACVIPPPPPKKNSYEFTLFFHTNYNL